MNEKKEVTQDFIMKPVADFCFKELMQDEKVRQGFIGAILGVNPEEIKETKLLPTVLRQEKDRDKLGILDVRVGLQDGTQMDLEMQVAAFHAWAERTLFYLFKMYTDQLKEGQEYDAAKKCIHVGILDFTLFEDYDGFYSRFHIWEDERREKYSDKLELHVLELSKLSQHEFPKTELLKWAKFFHAEKKEEFEMMAQDDEYLKRAYEKLKELSADEEKRMEYEAWDKALRDYNTQRKAHWRQGFQEGIAEGVERGIAQGVERGMAEGIERGIAQGVERGMAEGIERGIAQGVERGIAEGMEHGIQALIVTLKEVGLEKEAVSQKLMAQYDLKEEAAEKYMEQYW